MMKKHEHLYNTVKYITPMNDYFYKLSVNFILNKFNNQEQNNSK